MRSIAACRTVTDGQTCLYIMYSHAGCMHDSSTKVYSNMIPMVCSGIVLVYDVTSRKSFEDLIAWLEDVERYAPESTPVVLVGNKVDCTSRREVAPEEGKVFAQSRGLIFFETSPRCSLRIQEPFMALARTLRTKKLWQARQRRQGLVTLDDRSGDSSEPEQASTCCSWMFGKHQPRASSTRPQKQ